MLNDRVYAHTSVKRKHLGKWPTFTATEYLITATFNSMRIQKLKGHTTGNAFFATVNQMFGSWEERREFD